MLSYIPYIRLTLTILTFLHLYAHENVTIYKLPDGSFVLKKQDTLHQIPDLITAKTLRQFELGKVLDSILDYVPVLFNPDTYETGDPVEALTDYSPDGIMHRAIRGIQYIDSQPYWRSMHTIQGCLNPAIITIRGKLLIVYGILENNLIKLDAFWIDTDPASANYMNRDFTAKDFAIERKALFPGTRDHHRRADARLLTRHHAKTDEEFYLLTFSINPIPAFCRFTFVNITWSTNAAGESVLEQSEEIDMDYKPGGAMQKNWPALEYLDPGTGAYRLFFIERLHPLNVIEQTWGSSGAPEMVSILPEDWGQISALRMAIDPELPWCPEFGPMRGGTNLIPIRRPGSEQVQFYLQFFHTRARLPGEAIIDTYFMGAATHCPSPPFNIRSMSRLPIVKPELYDGPWNTNSMDYVVFPDGLVLDPGNSSQVLVSFGHQDKNGIIAIMDLEQLLDTLYPVHDCNLEHFDLPTSP